MCTGGCQRRIAACTAGASRPTLRAHAASPTRCAARSFSATSGSWRTCAWTTGGSLPPPAPTPARCWVSRLRARSSGSPRATAPPASTALPGSWWRPTSARAPSSSASTPAIPTSCWPRPSRAKRVKALADYPGLRREVKYGRNSRIDLLLECANKGLCYVEIKNVHLSRRHGLAEFPDSVTARGAKHLAEMSDMVRAGHRAVMVFLIQRSEPTRLVACPRCRSRLRPGFRCGNGGRGRGDRAALQDESGGDPGRPPGADPRLIVKPMSTVASPARHRLRQPSPSRNLIPHAPAL